MGTVNVERILPSYIGDVEATVPKYFTQFNIDRNVVLPCKYMECDEIEVSMADLEVNSVKIVDTIEGISIEGQCLTGKKLIILGSINTKLYFNCIKEIKCVCGTRKVCVFEEKIPFSSFIIVPNPICDNEPVNLKYLIENITTIKISNRKVFTSITILLEYIDEYCK